MRRRLRKPLAAATLLRSCCLRVSCTAPTPSPPPFCPVPPCCSGSDSEAESEEEGSEEEAFGGNFDETDAAYARAAASAEALDADERTGLGVAGVLRRLRLWAREYGERGFILLEAKELTRWCKITQR